MLELHFGQTNEKIVVTLTELQTLASPYYLIVFEHVTTKDIVTLLTNEDESLYPERYNQFNIETDVLFLDKQPGDWRYTAYEQESDSNTDPALALRPPLEYGQMKLYKESEFEYTKYNEPTSYKTYNG
jgi:hypothetical protein